MASSASASDTEVISARRTGALCLALAACVACATPPEVRPRGAGADRDEPTTLQHDRAAEPLDDPRAAMRYGYPPGTILRFSHAMQRSSSRIAPTAQADVGDVNRLFVFRACSDDDTCEDEVALRGAHAAPAELDSIRRFSQDTGLVEGVTDRLVDCGSAKCGVFELTIVRGDERFVFCVWSQPPHATQLIAIDPHAPPQSCRQASPPN